MKFKGIVKMSKLKIFISLCIVNCALLIGTAGAQDFGIYDLSSKTNLDSTDALMLTQAVDSTYYKVLWDRIVDSVEDSIKGSIINEWIKSGANIALNKLASGTAAYIVMANVSGVPTYTQLTGDATISDAGVITISNDAITSAKIDDETITSSDILNGTIASTDITDGTIASADIADSTIVNVDISPTAAIALNKLASGTAAYIVMANVSGVPTYTQLTGDATISDAGVITISNDAITSAKIDDETITSSDILNGTIALSKLATGTDGYIIVNNGSGVPAYVAMSGDATISNAGVIDLADNLSDNFVFSGKHSYPAQTLSSWTGGAQTINGTGLSRFVIIDVGLTSGVEITDITNGVDGQLLTIIASGAAYEGFTIKNNSEILLSGAVDLTAMDAYSTITLVYISATDLWVEISRVIR